MYKETCEQCRLQTVGTLPRIDPSCGCSVVLQAWAGCRCCVNQGVPFRPQKHKWQISNSIEAYIFNLDVSFLGKQIFSFNLIGRGRASALKVYAHTYQCQKIIFFKYSRIIHQKKRLELLINEQKSVLQNIDNCGLMAKNYQKKGKMAESGIFQGFLAITSAIFNILLNGFLLVHH